MSRRRGEESSWRCSSNRRSRPAIVETQPRSYCIGARSVPSRWTPCRPSASNAPRWQNARPQRSHEGQPHTTPSQLTTHNAQRLPPRFPYHQVSSTIPLGAGRVPLRFRGLKPAAAPRARQGWAASLAAPRARFCAAGSPPAPVMVRRPQPFLLTGRRSTSTRTYTRAGGDGQSACGEDRTIVETPRCGRWNMHDTRLARARGGDRKPPHPTALFPTPSEDAALCMPDEKTEFPGRPRLGGRALATAGERGGGPGGVLRRHGVINVGAVCGVCTTRASLAATRVSTYYGCGW